MNNLDLTPTWAGILPAFFAMLESGKGEGPKIAKEELARLAAFADSAIAEQKAAKANPPRYSEELAARRGRGLAADSLAGFARDFMTQGSFIRAACYWEAAARIAPADMEAARDFRVSADLAEREAAALLNQTFDSIRKEERAKSDSILAALAPAPGPDQARAALSEELQAMARDSFDGGQYRAAGAFYRAADLARPSPELRGLAQEASRIADSEALARRAAATEAARLLERAEFLAGAIAKDSAPHWRQFRQEARAALRGLAAFEVFPPIGAARSYDPAPSSPSSPSSNEGISQ